VDRANETDSGDRRAQPIRHLGVEHTPVCRR
jgi:hypothetical protein